MTQKSKYFVYNFLIIAHVFKNIFSIFAIFHDFLRIFKEFLKL